MLNLRKISTCLFLFFVTLSGRIIYEDHFGSPNYGENPETNLVETAVILILHEPITVKGNPERDYNSQVLKNIKKIQLVVPWEEIGQTDLSGKNVTVHGTLFEAITGHHRTEVLMSVNETEINP